MQWRELVLASLGVSGLQIAVDLIGNVNPTAFILVALLLVWPILALWLVVGIWSIVFAVKHVIQERRWTPAFVPLVPLTACIASFLLIPHINDAEDYLHFRALKSSYDAHVAKLPRDGHRFAEFNWGGMSYASKGVVYDETDEIALPPGHQSRQWKRRTANTDLTCGRDASIGPVTPLGDHYYATGFGC